jgi:flavin reductase (DIM6/NTAB) family NADH-FMN oxidoreductase RutF
LLEARSGREVCEMKRSLGARTLLYPTPAVVIGSYDKNGRANAATVAWAGICCSAPPCVAISLRKATYSYGCILERKAFTVNVPSEELVAKVDYLGMTSGKEEDKLATVGLTAVKSVLVDAPYIREFPLVLECKVIHITEIGLHTQFIGEIVDVKAEESVLDEKGATSIKRAKPFLYSPDDRNYYGIGELVAKGFEVGKRST